MNESKRIFILTGSSRGGRTTSQSVGEYLAERLAEQGVQSESMRVRSALKSEQGIADMLAAIEWSDVFVLVFPLFISNLPAMAIRALEIVAAHRSERRNGDGERKPFIAICQGGYPEACQSEAALAVCRQFAHEAGFEWAGGLAFGGGAVIGGQPLEKMGVFTKYPRQALDMTAEAIAGGQQVPDRAVETAAKLFLPTWLIPPILNVVMLLRVRQAGVLKSFRARPFVR
jgi:NAD(P)H-dependent FMN reductase